MFCGKKEPPLIFPGLSYILFLYMPELQGKKFQRRREDFECEKCGAEVKGTGYTDHCPHCLWAKHVDINPGDRAADCGGMMKPIAVVDKRKDDWIIKYRCEKCSHEFRVKSAPEDNFDEILKIGK